MNFFQTVSSFDSSPESQRPYPTTLSSSSSFKVPWFASKSSSSPESSFGTRHISVRHCWRAPMIWESSILGAAGGQFKRKRNGLSLSLYRMARFLAWDSLHWENRRKWLIFPFNAWIKIESQAISQAKTQARFFAIELCPRSGRRIRVRREVRKPLLRGRPLGPSGSGGGGGRQQQQQARNRQEYDVNLLRDCGIVCQFGRVTLLYDWWSYHILFPNYIILFIIVNCHLFLISTGIAEKQRIKNSILFLPSFILQSYGFMVYGWLQQLCCYASCSWLHP